MNRHRNRKLLILSIVFVAYNILVFVIPFRRNDVFWIAYAFSIVTILGQAAAYMVAFHKADNLKRVFLGVPIVKVAFRSFLAQMAVCAALMLISLIISIPPWIAVIPCLLILAFAAVAVIKADWAREVIEQIDAKSLAESKFIHQLRMDLEALIPRISNDALRQKVEKLSQEVRYSDLVSNVGLSELELEMEAKFAALKQAVISGSMDGDGIADELSFMLTERNNQTRVLRRPQ